MREKLRERSCEREATREKLRETSYEREATREKLRERSYEREAWDLPTKWLSPSTATGVECCSLKGR